MEQNQGTQVIMPSERADLLDRLQPSHVVEEIRRRLLGQEFINGKWTENKYMTKRSLSEVGAWEISSLMLPASSQNMAVSKLNSGQIRNRLLAIAKTTQKMCMRNFKEYNITGVDQLWFVHEIVFTNTMATLNQPEGEGIRKLLGTVGSADFSQPEPQSLGMGVFRQ